MSVMAVDIGGANLKVVRDDGRAWTEPFALWQQPAVLAGQLMEQWYDDEPALVLATMTGELCDCYATRAEGVAWIIDHLEAAAENIELRLWSMQRGFVTPTEARAAPQAIAAGNWHALASWLAPMWANGLTLLIDIGSTTTDVIPLRDGDVATNSRDDVQRLARGELVYMGADRTPLMALTASVTVDGANYPFMAEHFATIGDALALTGDGHEAPDAAATADGRPRTQRDAARRMLRMIGSDLDHHDETLARALAQQCRDMAVQRIGRAVQRVLGGETPERVVLSGSGVTLGRLVLDWQASDARRIDLATRIGEPGARAACAHALIKLWQRETMPP